MKSIAEKFFLRNNALKKFARSNCPRKNNGDDFATKKVCKIVVNSH